MLQDMWRRVGAHPTPCLDLKLVRRVPYLQGKDSGPWAYLGRGYEPACGANSSAPIPIILNFLLGS
jgi:hypothetical protein